ncbi:unnamed protein product [Urochloa decumbens]|uniref:NB-ARC domain-containing protein n=1 Tax=Urochloa decumbens TaxID=240449 RepID=A0ABC9AZD6_9POAL
MVATVASAVLGVVLGAVTKNVVALVVKLVEKRCELWKGFQNDMDFIKRELLMIAGAEEDRLSGRCDPSAVKSISMEEMRDLAHDIEDCLDRILRDTAECGGEASSLLRRVKAVVSPRYADEIKKLKERLKAAHQRKLDYNVNGGEPSVAGPAAALEFPVAANTAAAARVFEPVGIKKPKREVLELLDEVEGQPEQLSVISIVGFGGSGKSTLARAVYDSPEMAGRFPHRAWVVASEYRGDTRGLLMALFAELRPGDRANGDARQMQADIANHLSDKRYLIVFDDIEEQQWDFLKSTFPEKTSSRIIVTTTVQAVGNVCSHGHGNVYNMRTLDVKHSNDLLEAVLKDHLPGFEQSSKTIVNKCDGNPLALVSVANYLLRKNVLTEKDCEQICHSLGYYMTKEYAFRKLKQVLTNNYTSLPGHPLKTCLLYLCVFPNGHTIRRSSLTRRWLAEGYVQCKHPRSAFLTADENFEELIDRNIIRPTNSSRSAKVKTCRAHGIMHEFMLHMSMSAKFITSLGDPDRSNYRHLFMENPSSGKGLEMTHHHSIPTCGSTSGSEKLRARSLTICGSAGEAVADFTKCELLRVLDLEECTDLVEDNINGIHKLWHLKYLSLGATICNLPRKIEKLHCLETLDMRKTKIDTLPLEVVKLPHLAHLLGKFKLGIGKNDSKMSELCKFLSKESNLQTLAGFVADGSQGFPMLMVHMRKLKKVKIWYTATGEDSKSSADLSEAINKFVQDEIDTSVGIRSLSLDLGNSSGNILRSLENLYGYLSSLKLHGALSGLTQFATSLCGLTELCLSSTNNLTSNELSNLNKLMHLEHLKLVRVSLGTFVIRRRDFPRLLRLCLVQCSNIPTIEEGGLLKLVSLQLLSEDLEGLSGIKIESHKHLQEVVLDSTVRSETITTWENAAKKHPKKPRILFLQSVGPDMLKYVATERPSSEMGSSTVRGKREIHDVQPSLVIDLDSAMKRMRFSVPSPASTEMPRARAGTT